MFDGTYVAGNVDTYGRTIPMGKVLIPTSSEIPEWEQPSSTDPYMKGDKVKHNGKTWKSLVDNNVWEPGATGTESLWAEVTE